MRLWAVYSDAHAEVDIFGDREGLRALAHATKQIRALELALDGPPSPGGENEQPLQTIRIEPNDAQDERLCCRRVGSVLIIAGSDGELARIVGAAVSDVAEGPETKNGVRSHVHLDPTSDPDNGVYRPGSAPLTIGFTPSGV